MKEEIWKDIEGYEGKYMVSNFGRVKRLNYNKTGKEGILKARKSDRGYLHVHLSKDGKKKWYRIHRLVATAFCENPHGFKEVNHIDEDKENNKADNLEWCSRSYNMTYNGRAKKVAEKQRNNPRTSKPIIGIDKVTGLIIEFQSAKEAERQLGINNGNIIQCCKGKYKSMGGFYWYYADTTE